MVRFGEKGRAMLCLFIFNQICDGIMEQNSLRQFEFYWKVHMLQPKEFSLNVFALLPSIFFQILLATLYSILLQTSSHGIVPAI